MLSCHASKHMAFSFSIAVICPDSIRCWRSNSIWWAESLFAEDETEADNFSDL
jgi:hypothetical protein